MSLTPDLAEWLLADKKVCQRWRSLARRLNLGCHIPSIERLRGDDSGQLRMVLRMWQATFPDGYTVRGCKNVLAAEGLHHMCLWLSMMTQSTHSHLTQTPESQPTNPWKGYLYNQSFPVYRKAHSYTSDYYSYPSTPDTSRPSSRQSKYNSHLHSRASSEQSEYNYTHQQHHHQTYSCPSTPLCSRRNTQTLTSSDTKSSKITPSTFLTTKTPKSHSVPDKSTVYNLLYRPDLIKLSSPRIVRKVTRKTEILNKKHNNTVLKKYHSDSLPDLNESSQSTNMDKIKETNKQSDHEREILKLCDEIFEEMKCNDYDNDILYDINNGPRGSKPNQEDGKLAICAIEKNGKTNEAEGSNNSMKVNYFSVHKVKTIQLSSINQNVSEDEFEEAKDLDVVTSTSEYFANLVIIIEEAIKDMSTV